LSDPLTDPSGLFAFTGQTAGSYDVRIEDSMGWIFVDNIVIDEPSAITATATTTNARCPAGTLDGAIDITVSGGSGIYTYQWSNNRTTQDLTGIEAGSYTVQITDNATCTATFNFTVDPDIIVIADAGGDDLVCPYTPFMVCGSPGDSVVWGPLEYFDDPNSQCTMATVPDTTLFTYTVYDKASGCYANDQITIFAFEWFDMQIYDPAADEEVGDVLYLAEGDSYDLEADAGPFATYLWQPDQWITDPTNAAVTISPLGDIKYFVTGTTFNGCIEMDSVQLLIRRPIEIFSGFSPNNDGINDTWVITNAEQYGSLIRIKVFNRWGEPVFESKGYNNDWNGTRNGKPLPVATYYYIIEIEGTKPYTGTVTILR
jgi:gliding motility-associated-like protein